MCVEYGIAALFFSPDVMFFFFSSRRSCSLALEASGIIPGGITRILRYVFRNGLNVVPVGEAALLRRLRSSERERGLSKREE